jgi:hypothetical protein
MAIALSRSLGICLALALLAPSTRAEAAGAVRKAISGAIRGAMKRRAENIAKRMPGVRTAGRLQQGYRGTKKVAGALGRGATSTYKALKQIRPRQWLKHLKELSFKDLRGKALNKIKSLTPRQIWQRHKTKAAARRALRQQNANAFNDARAKLKKALGENRFAGSGDSATDMLLKMERLLKGTGLNLRQRAKAKWARHRLQKKAMKAGKVQTRKGPLRRRASAEELDSSIAKAEDAHKALETLHADAREQPIRGLPRRMATKRRMRQFGKRAVKSGEGVAAIAEKAAKRNADPDGLERLALRLVRIAARSPLRGDKWKARVTQAANQAQFAAYTTLRKTQNRDVFEETARLFLALRAEHGRGELSPKTHAMLTKRAEQLGAEIVWPEGISTRFQAGEQSAELGPEVPSIGYEM